MNIVCIIPARYESTRFPGKPLARIAGYPMIQWVYNRAASVPIFKKVLIATDDQRIADVVKSFGGECIMTSSELNSGTDRVAFVAQEITADIIVNLQGDEPLISTTLLEECCRPYAEPDVIMTTPVKLIKNVEELLDPNLARVILDRTGNALYFSRSQIPFVRDVADENEWLKYGRFYRHIGLYSYRKDFLIHLASLPPGELEKLEKLEQLRVLEYGFKIRTVLTDYISISVDTPSDLEKIEKYVIENNYSVDDVHEKV
jgi:3-deoxy-manno-octulosonate cytidylyltransferase (CMP-KDO synthetase)